MSPEMYVAGFLLTLAACGGSPEVSAGPSTPGIGDVEFQARPTAAGVEFTNHGAATVYYRAHDPMSLALSDRIPCLEPAHCAHVPARSRVTVPFEEAIVGYRSDTERATVYWWHFVPDPDGSLTPDEVRTLQVIFQTP